jgi:hypothetical protein
MTRYSGGRHPIGRGLVKPALTSSS